MCILIGIIVVLIVIVIAQYLSIKEIRADVQNIKEVLDSRGFEDLNY